VGTVILGRSARKSVTLNDFMHSTAAAGSDCRPSSMASWRCASVTFSCLPAEKNWVVNWSKNPSRSLVRPLISWAAAVSGPSGLSGVWARYGGTAAANTTLCSHSWP